MQCQGASGWLTPCTRSLAAGAAHLLTLPALRLPGPHLLLTIAAPPLPAPPPRRGRGAPLPRTGLRRLSETPAPKLRPRPWRSCSRGRRGSECRGGAMIVHRLYRCEANTEVAAGTKCGGNTTLCVLPNARKARREAA